MKKIILCILVSFIFGVAAYSSECETVAGFYGATSEQALSVAAELAEKKDAVSFALLLKSGRLFKMKSGAKVEIRETNLENGFVKICSDKNKSVCFWTTVNAIECE